MCSQAARPGLARLWAMAKATSHKPII